MAVDRSLNLRPGVLDIADIVDSILNQITPVVYGASNLTFRNGFTPYDDTSANNKIKAVLVNNSVYLSGAVKPTTLISAGVDTIMCQLPTALRPATRKYFVCQGSSMNRYGLVIQTNGNLYLTRYGTNSAIDTPSGAFLRIDCAYSLA